MSSLAVRREPDTGSGEEAGSSAGDAFAALAVLAWVVWWLDRATRAAEELADAVAGREIRVRAIADAAVSAGTASRRLRIAR
jgi:hypothetical protein